MTEQWCGAFDRALRECDAPAGSTAFWERRWDLAVRYSTELGPVSEARQASGGVVRRGYRGPEGVAPLTDPNRAGDWVQAVLADREVPGGRTDASPWSAPDALQLGPRAAWVTELALGIQRRLPGSEPQIRWSALIQHVATAAVGSAPRQDRRLGARLGVACRWRGHLLERHWSLRLTDDAATAPLIDDLEAAAAELGPSRGIDGGDYPIVFAPGAAGVLFHELVGHACEGDHESARRRLAEVAPQLPRELKVIDDPRRARIPWTYDDEAQPARPVALLRSRGLGDPLLDLRCAKFSGRSPNGHGRRSSFADLVQPRMGCTFVAAGPADPDELIADVTAGLYVRAMQLGRLQPESGRALFRVVDATWIEQGRLAEKLLPCVLILDDYRSLTRVEGVAHDLALDSRPGNCIKQGQPLPTTVGAPTIRLGWARVKT